MSSIVSAVLRLFSRSGLSSLERRLLSEVQFALRPAARDLFAKQVESLNLVQRHIKGREVCCYTMKGRSVRRDPHLQFPNTARELKLASVQFGLAGREERWTARFYLVEGYFFSIIFDQPTAGIPARDDIQVLKVQVHADPMEARRVEPAGPQAVHLTGWLASWASRYEITEVHPPLSERQRQGRVSEVTATLPEDYLEVVRQTDGLSVNGCTILGLTDLREVVMEESDFFILGELRGDGVLAVRDGAADGQVYYLDYSDPLPRKVEGLREALEIYLTSGKL